MSILQIELPEEVRAELEARAAAQGRDLGSWALERLQEEARQLSPEQEAKRQALAQHLLQRADEPLIEATPEWWEQLTRQTTVRVDAEHSK